MDVNGRYLKEQSGGRNTQSTSCSDRLLEVVRSQLFTQICANCVSYLDQQVPCGLVAYRVRSHRHDSQQYSPFSNVASRTKSCGDSIAGLMATSGGNGMTSTRGPGEVSWWTWRGWLYWTMLVGLLLLVWRHGARVARTPRHRGVLRPATHLAHVGLLMFAALLWPASTLAQSGQVVEYYHLDALGSVRAVSNEQGQVVSRHDFLPFGEEWTPATPQRENKLFTGHERDPETGLDYFGARYYDNRVGRFTSPDPISVTSERMANPQRLNRYAYAANNPLRYIDPNGLDIITYDEQGIEIESERVKQSKWHNFWFGDSYKIATASGTFDIAEPLTALSDGEAYTVVDSGATSELVSDFLAVTSAGSSRQCLSWREIRRRATGDWNWKVSLNHNFGPHALFMLEGVGQRSDYLGNYAFGYLMNAWDPTGPNTALAKWGGALFNFYDSVKSMGTPFKGSLLTGYDDPRDFAAINAGAALYRRTR